MMPHRESLRRRCSDAAAVAIVTFVVAFVLIPATPDVDLWGHVRFGGDIAYERAIPAADTYSFTSDRPWINHEWLTELSMYSAFALAGPAGLTMLRLALVALMLALVGWSLARDGVRAPRLHVLLAFVAILTFARTQHIRPQLYSLVLFAALLVLIRLQDRRPRAIFLVPLLMAGWVNLHGGWIVGLGALGLWASIEAVSAGCTWRRRIELGAVVCLAAGATLVNPYGSGMWAFLWETVGLGRTDISEWLPMVSAQPGVIVLWSTTAAAALWAIRLSVAAGLQAREESARWSDVAIVAALGILSFRVSRLDAFFCLAVFILLVPRAWSRVIGPEASAWRRSLSPATPAYVGLLTAAAIVTALAVRWPAATSIDLTRATWLPEPDVVAYLRSQSVGSRVLTYFDWGEYAIWHLSPRVKVSMDGRRETVYSSAPIAGHLAVYDNLPGALEYVRHLQPDYIWLPKTSPVVRTLQSTGAWTTAFDGPRSSLLARRGLCRDGLCCGAGASAPPAEPRIARVMTSGARPFPGP
jgi:hypothetical protein